MENGKCNGDTRGGLKGREQACTNQHMVDLLQEKIKDQQHPYYPCQVEDEMCPGGPFRRDIGDKRSNIGGYCGADILTQHHGGSHIKRYPAIIAHYKGKGHGGTGGLYYEGQDGTY